MVKTRRMKCILLVLLICAYTLAYPQTQQSPGSTKARQFIFFELGKTGLIYNLGYDHQLPGRKTGFRFAGGSNLGKYQSLFNIGGGVFQLFGGLKNYFEIGVDIYYMEVNIESDDQIGSLIYPDYPIQTFYLSANIGYRRSTGKRLFRIGISPGLTKDEFIPGGYISFGIGF
jgi:hypothetical protein